MSNKPSYLNFDKGNYYWKADVDYRLNPEIYKVGEGEQGVLICNPYKSEILPFWKFKTPKSAKFSSKIIYQLFLHYISTEEFVGADMARKFLQMGYTRARRYFNYQGGRKFRKESYEQLEKGTGDPQKAISAQMFYKKWQQAENHKKYKELKKAWKEIYG